jgi:hypothetical protein
MTTAKKPRLDPALEKAISTMLRDVMKDKDASITDKMKVIDRALKLEAIKQKMSDDGYGSGFFNDETEGG